MIFFYIIAWIVVPQAAAQGPILRQKGPVGRGARGR